MVELPPLILCARCFFFSMLPYYFTVYIIFKVVLAKTLIGASRGSCPLVFLVGQLLLGPNVLWSTYPIQKSTIVNTDGIPTNAKKLFVSGRSVMVWIAVSSHCIPQWKWCTGTTWCAGKCTGQPTYQRYWEGCYFAIVQNSSTSMGVGSSFFLNFAP